MALTIVGKYIYKHEKNFSKIYQGVMEEELFIAKRGGATGQDKYLQ